MWKILPFLLLLASARSFYSSTPSVVDLTTANFEELVVQGDEVWIVEFYAPWCGHCQDLAPVYKKTADALKGVIKVGAVNVDDHRGLAERFNVEGFPTVMIFGVNKNKPMVYEGKRTPLALVDVAFSEARMKVQRSLDGKKKKEKKTKSDVVELTDGNFDKMVIESEDMWMVEFYAPWCGHCKKFAPEWTKAASRVQGQVRFGAVDATVNTLKSKEYQVDGYPTIKVFLPGKKRVGAASTYKESRAAEDIANYALDVLFKNLPPPEINEIHNESVFEKACKNGLCIISFLPHILECQSKCRNDYLDILRAMTEEFKRNRWGWLWVEGGAQQKLEAAFDVGGFGYPTMVVLSLKKMKYSSLKGSFSRKGIGEFLKELVAAKAVSSSSIYGEKIPTIESVEPWDGKDGELPDQEEKEAPDADDGEPETKFEL